MPTWKQLQTLKQLQEDFAKKARGAGPAVCTRCSRFDSLLHYLKEEGDPGILQGLLKKVGIKNASSGEKMTFRDVAYNRLFEWIKTICTSHSKSQSGNDIYTSIAPLFFIFISNAQATLSHPTPLEQASFAHPPSQQRYEAILSVSKEIQLANLVKNQYVQSILRGEVNFSELNTVLAVFGYTISPSELKSLVEAKDTTRLEEAKLQASLLISAAVINGNERESDKFGRLMELVELKFGKKPERMSEDTFMQKVASQLLAGIESQHLRLCLGVQYIQTWAKRQFTQTN